MGDEQLLRPSDGGEDAVKINATRFLDEYVWPFGVTSTFYYNWDIGFIVWRLGTGRNVELLHIRAWETRKGHGRLLFYKMLDALSAPEAKPYHSVYGFTRVSNERSALFYQSMGFHFNLIPGVYKDGEAILFYHEYEDLVAYQKMYQASKVSL